MDCSIFRPGDYGRMLRSRILRMCEKDSPRAILINGDIHLGKDTEQFLDELRMLKIPFHKSTYMFENHEYHDVLACFVKSLGDEIRHPKNDILYKVHIRSKSVERVYLDLFIRHKAIDEHDLLAEIEERLRRFGKDVNTIVIKQKMN